MKNEITFIIDELRLDQITLDETISRLSLLNLNPNILNDDNEHWAVDFGTVGGDEEVKIFEVASHRWKETIREAFISELVLKLTLY